ncbi:Uma2 family endonuclease [Actinacidiphila rubida]|uniref:Putative restriction endonuclease n=1 Tax=Actinacidiphila rubida TaxID=310780 RepID=A0A1H8SGW8_9ACTN|nr:Uma2 family endonuclease [Actinacidiphila rubida]SEO77912.1 Putative restriction endonuclease [Actinacidiphila rubida]
MTVLDELWREIDATVKTEGFKIEILDGKVVMTPQSPEQDWTIDEIKSAVRKAGIAFNRLVSKVAIDFPDETSSAPDVSVLDKDAHRNQNRFTCIDLLAAFEVVSRPGDRNDYVIKVEKYGRYGVGVYVIADPFTRVCTLFEKPNGSGYGERTELPYGESFMVRLATGESFTVDTGTFPVKEA